MMIFTGRTIIHYHTIVPAKRVINVLNNVELFSWYHPRIQDAKLRMDGWYLIREQRFLIPVFYLMRLKLRQRTKEPFQDCLFETKVGWFFRVQMRFSLSEMQGETKISEVIKTHCFLPIGWICRWIIKNNHRSLIQRYEREVGKHAIKTSDAKP